MDYIYQEITEAIEREQPTSYKYVHLHETAYLYLLRITASEIWWRLRCNQSDQVETIYARSAYETLRSLQECTQSAFHGQETLNHYNGLLKKLQRVRVERNRLTHNDALRLSPAEQERVQEIHDLLKQFWEDAGSASLFPVFSDEWVPVIPISSQDSRNVCQCKMFKPITSGLTGMRRYAWVDGELPANTPEFRREGFSSETTIRDQRLYFVRITGEIGAVPEVSCAYPFIQVKFDTKTNTLSQIWVYDNVANRQNGMCNGTDLLPASLGNRDTNYIPELQSGVSSDNPYLLKSDTDSWGNPLPTRNVYNRNYEEWNENASVRNTIWKLTQNLKKRIPFVYLYGQGGVGKTATIHQLLENNYYRAINGRPVYDFLIFLSAKKKEFVHNAGLVSVAYTNGLQTFEDTETLRAALKNIFAYGEAEEELPQDPNAPDAHLFEGKNILLVLDDFESVDEPDRPQLMEYLERNFITPSDYSHPHQRQVIITCRATPGEGYAANVLLEPLSENDTAAFARFVARLVDNSCARAYEQTLGTGSHAKDLTGRQRDARRLLHLQSKGIPLMIRLLVLHTRSAQLDPNIRYNKDLEDYLKRDIYSYLSDNALKKLAVIAAILTGGMESCDLKRLRFVWESDETNPGSTVEQLLDILVNYGVIVRDADKKWQVSFPDKALRDYLLAGYEKDRNKDVVLSPDSRLLAGWMSREPNRSLPQRLLNQLCSLVCHWYTLHGMDQRYREAHGMDCPKEQLAATDGELLSHMIQLYRLIRGLPGLSGFYRRCAIQAITQLDYDEQKHSIYLFDNIFNPMPAEEIQMYPAEYLRVLDAASAEDVATARDACSYFLNTLRFAGDNRDYLLILWSHMLLAAEMHKQRIPIPDGFTTRLNESTGDLSGRFNNLSGRECRIFAEKLEQILPYLPAASQSDSRAAACLAARCADLKEIAARLRADAADPMFFGAN